MQLSAVILAGGQSKRMGRDKGWVEYEGKPLIQAALEKVQRLGISEVFISGRADQDYSVFERPVLTDLEPGLGPISGIELALREATSPLVLVLAVDLPKMSAEFLQKLIRSCDRLTGAIPQLYGEIEPLAAIYPSRCHTYASLQIAQGDYTVHRFARACLREHAVRLLQVRESEAGFFANCNTPADLAFLSNCRQFHETLTSIKTRRKRAS